MEQHIFRLARACGINTNPTTFTQRTGTFASAATNNVQATLLTRCEKTGLNGYLTLPAGTSPEIIAWIRDQGRSYGIRAMLATQRPEQLMPSLRNNILTYSTLISFAQTDPLTASEVAANVGSSNEWTAEDIQHVAPYHVVVRSEVDQRRQSAFIVKLPNFEADMSSYATGQGYTHEPAGAYPW